MKIRLDKMLSHLGYGSRKEVKALLKKQALLVNDKRVKEGKVLIDTVADKVRLSGEELIYEEYVYYMLHKPSGVITANEDNQHKTVMDLFEAADLRKDLFAVGRLDKDTTGLLLVTNDGALDHALRAPNKKVPKRYLAKVAGIPTAEDQAMFAKGFKIDGDEWVKPSQLEILSIDEGQQQADIALTIVEGKYHQVKRMMSKVGAPVLTLHRESMGGLCLDPTLKRGTYRKLTEDEVAYLKNQAK